MSHPASATRRHASLLGLTLMVALCPGLAAASAVLEKAPTQTLACLKIKNLNGTLMQTDQFLAGVSPLGVSMFAKMGLGQVLGSPLAPGVDMNGDFALFVAAMTPGTANAGPMPPISVAALVPVTDYAQFLAGNTNCGPADSQGISQLTSPALPPLFIASLSNFALIGPAQDKASFVQLQQEISAQSRSLFASLGEDLQKEADARALWLYCNVPMINQTFGPLIKMQLQMAKAMAPAMQAQAGGGMDPGAIIDRSGRMLSDFLEQSRYLTLSLEPSGDALRLTKSFGALPGTDLAACLQGGDQAQKNAFLAHLTDNALVNVAYNGTIEAIWQKQVDVIATLGTGFLGEKGSATLKTILADVQNLVAGGGAYSMLPAKASKPPVQMRYLFDATEAGQFLPVLRASIMPSVNTSLADMGGQLGFTPILEHTAGGQSYQGVAIDQTKLTLQIASGGPPQGQALSQMAKDLQFRWASMGKACLCVFGGDSDGGIRQMIDSVKAGQGPEIQSEARAALTLLPGAERSDLFVTFNALRIFDLVTALTPDLPKVTVPPSKSNLVFAARLANGKATLDLVLPKTHLIEIRDLVQGVMMQKMGAEGTP